MLADPVSQLREAAALMRESVRSVPPAPWRAGTPGADGAVLVTAGDDSPVADCSFSGDLIADDIAAAGYVASWHPGVVLAVADWLDFVADADSMHSHAAACNCRDRALIGRALTVARSYLGREDA